MEIKPASDKIYTVSELNARADTLLRREVGEVWVRGEITGLKTQSSGHVYFSLKDAGGVVSVAFFKFAAAKCAVKLVEGKQVLVYGSVGIYQERGSFQLVAKFVLEEGIGKLQQEFERLKRQLETEGLFSAERKVALPALPKVVGFVTSPTGAVLQDFYRILKRRDWRGRLILFPASVQGSAAEAEIKAALELADNHPDVELIVVGRGGGSLEDLWSFNTETVVRAVAACQKPIISAVGHETDVTLCDFAADMRAETPSAAAELIAHEFNLAREKVAVFSRRMPMLAKMILERLVAMLSHLKERLLGRSPKSVIERHYQTLDFQAMRLVSLAKERKQAIRASLNTLEARLKGVSPQATLERGYTMLSSQDGKYLTRAASLVKLTKDEIVKVCFADGEGELRR